MLLKNLYYKLINWIDPPKYLEDEYLNWLNFANAGMLDRGNIYAMNYAIERIPSDSPIVEIGSFCGLSTNTLSYLLSKNERPNKIFTSDKWVFENSEKNELLGKSDINHENYRNFVIQSFKNNLQFFSSKRLPYSIELFSDNFFKAWDNSELITDVFGRQIKLGGPVSFSYIDGNHSFEFTKRDFENVDNHLEIGGFILFDDTSDRSSFGCGKFMSNIKRDSRYKLIMKNPNYLFKKIRI